MNIEKELNEGKGYAICPVENLELFRKLRDSFVDNIKTSSESKKNIDIVRREINKMSKGTKFQRKVWKYLKKIPRGKTKTYSEVASAIGSPSSIRAVANAVGKNPYPPRIPCHRVIRSDGSLGGYSGKGGIRTKRILLKKEGIVL